jgi:hypothetical protein
LYVCLSDGSLVFPCSSSRVPKLALFCRPVAKVNAHYAKTDRQTQRAEFIDDLSRKMLYRSKNLHILRAGKYV